VALAGNPNTGKSTLFNALTGLKQHTGNWPGKTVTRAEGGFEFNKVRYKLVDLPGTYSLLSASHDEEIRPRLPVVRAAGRDRWSSWTPRHRAQSEPRAAGARDYEPRGRSR
jgi:ribosome-interacting GTPase 1